MVIDGFVYFLRENILEYFLYEVGISYSARGSKKGSPEHQCCGVNFLQLMGEASLFL